MGDHEGGWARKAPFAMALVELFYTILDPGLKVRQQAIHANSEWGFMNSDHLMDSPCRYRDRPGL
jgi:hypothetical protein